MVIFVFIEVDLKGQCHEILNHCFCLKGSTWAPYEQTKLFLKTFSREDIFLSLAKLTHLGPLINTLNNLGKWLPTICEESLIFFTPTKKSYLKSFGCES